MFYFILLACIFFFGFFIESLLGFGGVLLSVAILSFFIDIKDIIPISTYAGLIGSSIIILTNYKSISWSILFKNIIPFALLGTFIGLSLFPYLGNDILLKIFSILLIFFSLKSFFFEKFLLIQHKYLKSLILILGGISSGLYGIIGPFVAVSSGNDFPNKNYLRSTLASLFIFLNIVRIIQFTWTNEYSLYDFFEMWWLIFPLSLSIFLGYYMHLKISEEIFKKLINFLILIAGIICLLR